MIKVGDAIRALSFFAASMAVCLDSPSMKPGVTGVVTSYTGEDDAAFEKREFDPAKCEAEATSLTFDPFNAPEPISTRDAPEA